MLSIYRKARSLVLSEQICSLMGLPVGTRIKKSAQARQILKKENLQITDFVDMLECASFGHLYLASASKAAFDFKAPLRRLPIAIQYFRIGVHFSKQNILTASAEAYEKALAIYPYLVPARIELAKLKQKLFQHHVACRILEEGVQLNPCEPSLWANLAMFQMRLGMQARSEESLNKALELRQGGHAQPTAKSASKPLSRRGVGRSLLGNNDVYNILNLLIN